LLNIRRLKMEIYKSLKHHGNDYPYVVVEHQQKVVEGINKMIQRETRDINVRIYWHEFYNESCLYKGENNVHK
jgi:creatinine amidohydrolase/Fe(II)-dependent formamide hydrolase-like protein